MSKPFLTILCLPLVLGGCDDTQKYPTAPAPKTLKVAPMAAMGSMASGSESEDDEGEDDEGEGSPRPVPEPMAGAAQGLGVGAPQGSGGEPALAPGAGGQVATINGHPQGPRAEVFNAVVNNAFSSALSCFEKASANQTLVFRVQMTVGNEGSVEEAKVVSGPELEDVRSCLVGVVKRLTFPSFQGPKVSQTIPFAAVRQGGGAAAP
ncbi:MAG: hypothetical protein RBU30_02435 [Polyangia bacterium]|jgi:hypothetical protein|nr:hypothetical protein [Polyangia bacterium]